MQISIQFTKQKLSKINIRSSWSRFKHCSESLIYPLWSHTHSLFALFHMESWPKVKLGSHYVPLLGFIYSYFAPNIPFWSRFRLVYLYFPIFSFIYLYLPTFSRICPYLVIFTLNCPNLTIYAIFTPHIYSSSKTAPLCKILKQSENESWRITHLAHRKSYLVIICPNSDGKFTKREIM